MSRKCLVVLGMHRSGTSALMGVLNILGVELGPNLMAPGMMNIKGFYENQDVCALNEKILRALGSRWDDSHMYPDGWWDGIYKRFEPEISSLIDSNFRQDTFGIKDPRLCRLFPLWNRVLAGKGIEVSCIIPVRNPLEVAGSWKQFFTTERSLLIWMANMLEAEHCSRGVPRIITTYSGLLSDTQFTISEVVKGLGITLPRSLDDYEVRAEVASFVDLGLRHHTLSLNRLDMDATGLIRKLYGLIAGHEFSDCKAAPVLAAIDDIRTHYALHLAFFSALGDTLKEEKEDLRARLGVAGQEKEDLKAQLGVAVQEAQRLTEKIAWKEALLVQRDSEILECRAAYELRLGEQARRISDVETELEAVKAEREAVKAELEAVKAELIHIHNSDFWALATRYYRLRDHTPMSHVFNAMKVIKRAVSRG